MFKWLTNLVDDARIAFAAVRKLLSAEKKLDALDSSVSASFLSTA